MNESSQKQNRQWLRQAFWIWLVIFIAIAGLLAWLDLGAMRQRVHTPPYWQQGLMSAAGATLGLGLCYCIRWPFTSWRHFRRTLVGLAIFATLVAIFYTEEDWRGKRAWENCKRDLEAKGAVLDWNAYIPPPVPDDQNFFTYSTNILLRFQRLQTPEQGAAAAKLSWLRLEPTSSNSFPFLVFSKTNSPVIAELTILLPGAATNGLAINLNDSSARDKIQGSILTTVGRSVNGSQGFHFSELQLRNLSPAKIILQADALPSADALNNLIPSDLVSNIGVLAVAATADPAVFQVKIVSGSVTAAADYIKWSAQFVPAFDEVRAALKRPCAILPGDYSQAYAMPIPNFVIMRALAQTLAQRTQCYLLLGQPDLALHELTLMKDACRILEKPPTGKPETLVEAMINVAITGVYAITVQDGLRLRAWREPQLQAIQSQMETIRLLPFVTEAFREQQVQAINFTTKPNLAKYFSGEMFAAYGLPVTFWDKVKSHAVVFIPQGWIDQNLKFGAEIEQKEIDCFDPNNEQVFPERLDKANSEFDQTFSQYSPFQFIALFSIPNFTKAIRVCALNQTLVNEAQIVCALERYRLAHGEYPETLDMLVPQFIEKLPRDIIGGQPLYYRRTDDGKFLLYSVGWDKTGNAVSPGTSDDVKKGNWVWKN
jgi:hypothetical protein